jgi:hypothetical protein
LILPGTVEESGKNIEGKNIKSLEEYRRR